MDRSYIVTINPKDGAIQIDGFTLILVKGTLIDSVKTELFDVIQAENDMLTGYRWVHLKSLTFGNQPAGLSLCFLNKKLDMVTIEIAMPDDEDDQNWPTEATSLRQVEFMRKELERQLSCNLDKQNFIWGSAWANFDIKGFMASAGIRYK
jgi:hypothetical protein